MPDDIRTFCQKCDWKFLQKPMPAPQWVAEYDSGPITALYNHYFTHHAQLTIHILPRAQRNWRFASDA